MVIDPERNSPNMMDFRERYHRARVDYAWKQDGRVVAHLTVNAPGGTTFRFAADADPRVVLQLMKEQHPEVAGFSLGHLMKGVGKIAKGIATNKVFALAAKALKAVAPLMGPLGAGLTASSLALSAATKLVAAKKYAARGNKAAAAKLVASAAADASQSPSAPPAQVLDAANEHAKTVYTLMLQPK